MPHLDRLLSLVRKAPGAQRAGRFARTVRQVPDAVRLVTDPERSQTFYPDADRKGALRMIADNVGYLFRHGEVDAHYFQYGLDREKTHWSDVVPYAEFRRLRDRRNAAQSGQDFNYLCVLRDKFVFGQLVGSLGYPTPRTLAFVHPDAIERLMPREVLPLNTLLKTDLDGFCKPFDGILGRGAFSLQVVRGQPFINGRLITLDDLQARLNGRYLLQERIVQHHDLLRLHPPSVNALRVITVLEEGAARLFSTHLRVGANGEPTNSFSTGGGVAVRIDETTGKLIGRGLKRGQFVDRHPDTGVRFDGYEVPFFSEAVTLACRIHEDLRFFHSVGWDVAITPTGPLFIEGNDNWGGGITMALEPDFKDRFSALYQ